MSSVIEFGYQLPWSLILAGFVILLLTWIIGKFLSLFLSDEPAFDGHIGLGALVLSTLIAIAITKFKTVFAVVLPLFLLLILIKRKKIDRIYSVFSHEIVKDIAILSGFFIFIFLLQANILYVEPDDWAVNYIDNYSYIFQINFMLPAGLETKSYELEKLHYGFDATPKPYHYFEMWPAILAKILTGKSGYFIFNLFLIPYLAAILLFQNLKILRNKYGISLLQSVCISVLVFTTLRFVFIDDWVFDALKHFGLGQTYSKFVFFQNYGYWHFFSYMYGMKLLVSAIFITPVFYYFMNKNQKMVWLYAGIMPIISLVYIPFAFAASGIQFLFSRNRRNLFLVFLPLFVVLWIGIFYRIHASGENPGIPVLSLNLVFKQLISALKNPFALGFGLFNFFFSTWYWLFFPIILYITIKHNSFVIRAISIWLLLYPLTGISFQILFKIYFLGGALLIVAFLVRYWRLVTDFKVLSFLLLILGFQLIEIAIPKFIDSHQIFALTVPPMFYIFANLLWGSLLRTWKLSALWFSFILFFILNNLISIRSDNMRSFVRQKADQTFLLQLFSRLAPDKKIKSVYCSAFTLFPFLHYDRVGDELSFYTDSFTTTVFSIDLLSRADSALADEVGAASYLRDLPIAKFIQKNKSKGVRLDDFRLLFLSQNRIPFVFRKDN